jgi:hypothetical protein
VSCTATQDAPGGDPVDDEPLPTPGTTIRVPVDTDVFGIAVEAPVTSNYRGIDYGVVGVLYDQTPLTNSGSPAPEEMSVLLGDLGFASVSRIYMIVHSSFVPDLPNDVDMGTLTVSYAEGGPPTTLDFSLGRNTAEWSYDRPEHGTVAHSLADTIYTFPTTIDSAFTYDGREYAVMLTVDPARTIACIQLDLPDPSTYSLLRDPSSPTATWASQYVAAMTLEGTAGTPAAVGSCALIDDPCAADGVCNDACADGEDPDCDEPPSEIGCDVTGCADDENCYEEVCVPFGTPTEGVCPAAFDIDVGVFSPSIVTLVYDRFEINQSLSYAATCNYIRQDGGSGAFAISLFYTPLGAAGSPSGLCGSVDEDGDNIVANNGFSSTVRTVSALSALSGSVRIVDPTAVFTEFIGKAVDAGVGSACSVEP